MFIYRPEYYGLEVDESQTPTRGMAELIIAKHRNGAIKNVYARFIDKFAKFVDMDFAQSSFENRPSQPGMPPSTSTITVKSKMDQMSDEEETPF